MRIAQISDFHFTHLTWNPFRLFSKRLLGNLNWLVNRKSSFSHVPLEKLPALFSELNVDLILFGGDFTTTSLKKEYEKASSLVSKFSQKWIAIPGNHDHYTYRSFRKKHFYKYFSNEKKEIFHPIDFFNLEQHGVEVHQIGPNWWLIALDTARPTPLYSSKGFFGKPLEEYLREILALLPDDASVILLNHYPFFPLDHALHSLERGDALQKMIQESPQIRLYLHGHTHKHAITDLQPSLPILLDSGCSAQEKEGTWNLIDLLPDHCRVTAYSWENKWKPFREELIQWKK